MKKPILHILTKMLPFCATVLKLVQKKASPLKSIPNSLVKNPYSLIKCGTSISTQSFRASRTYSAENKIKRSPAKFVKKRRRNILNDIILSRSCGVRPSMTDSFRAWHLQHEDAGHRGGKRNRPYYQHYRFDSSNAPIQREDPRYGFVDSDSEDCWWNDFQFSDHGSEYGYAVSCEGEKSEGQNVVISGNKRRGLKVSSAGRREIEISPTGCREVSKSPPISRDMVNLTTDSSAEARHYVDRRAENTFMSDLGAESIIVPEPTAGDLDDEDDKENIHDTKRRRKGTANCNKGKRSEASKQMPLFPESKAMAKLSLDPCTDFASSMTEMIVAHGITESREMVDLFRCYLRLNSPAHHSAIAVAFVTALAAMDATCRQRDEFIDR